MVLLLLLFNTTALVRGRLARFRNPTGNKESGCGASHEQTRQERRERTAGEEAVGRSGRRSAVGGVGGTDWEVGVGAGSLIILAGVLVHRATRPQRQSVFRVVVAGRYLVCRFN